MYYYTAAVRVTERIDMTQLDRIESLFHEARRSAFGISFLCFIGTGISLVGLSMLDPALGTVIPALIVVVLALFTMFFLLLSFRLFQPISEIIKMVNKLYADVMRDEMGIEPTGAGAETEKRQLKELTQQVKDLKKEISVIKNGNGHVSSAVEHNGFWMTLILKWLFFVAVVLGMTFIIPNALDVLFIIFGVVGLTIIALAHAHNRGRLKWPNCLRWLRRKESIGAPAKQPKGGKK